MSSTGHIHLLEVFNFKSYRGHQTIGPFRNFTAIVGPNGSGKSNVMDAIGFVLGIRTDQLRGKLKELLYNGGAVGECGFVKLVFEQSDGRQVTFAREIQSAGGTTERQYGNAYKIDGEAVTLGRYLAQLETYGILVKARNFLVFQGDIESVASMDPRSLTKMLEQVSGSIAFERDYTRLSLEKEKAESTLMQLHGRRKHIVAEAKQKRGQMTEARRHGEAERELKIEKERLCAWHMYVLEKEAAQVQSAAREAEHAISSTERQCTASHQLLQQKRASLQSLIASIEATESKSSQLKTQLTSNDPESVRLEEEKQRLIKRKTSIEKQRIDCLKRFNDWTSRIKKLENDLLGLEDAWRKFQDVSRSASQSGVVLSDADMREYLQIKHKIVGLTGRLQQEKSKIDYSLTTSEASMNRLIAKKEQLENGLEAMQKGKEELEHKREEGRQEMRTIDREMEEREWERKQSARRMKEMTKKRDDVTIRMHHLDREIAEGKAIRRESKRDAKIAESIDKMQRTIHGIYGRATRLGARSILSIQDPSSILGSVRQSKYRLAMAMALGSDLDAVLVESTEAAKTGIQFLKDNRYPPLTFIPMDVIDPNPVDENLRRLGGSAKLAVDLLDFDRKFEKGFRFLCNNAVVCDSIEEAKHLAYQRKVPPCE